MRFLAFHLFCFSSLTCCLPLPNRGQIRYIHVDSESNVLLFIENQAAKSKPLHFQIFIDNIEVCAAEDVHKSNRIIWSAKIRVLPGRHTLSIKSVDTDDLAVERDFEVSEDILRFVILYEEDYNNKPLITIREIDWTPGFA